MVIGSPGDRRPPGQGRLNRTDDRVHPATVACSYAPPSVAPRRVAVAGHCRADGGCGGPAAPGPAPGAARETDRRDARLHRRAGFRRDRVRRAGFGPSPGTTQIDTPSVVKIGLTSHLQLDLFVSASAIRQAGGTAGGLADAAVGLKWRLASASPVLGDFAVQATLKLPTGSETEGTSTGTTDISLLAISSRSIGPFAIDLTPDSPAAAATARGLQPPRHSGR